MRFHHTDRQKTCRTHSRESETKPTHTQKLINGRGSHRDQGGKGGLFFFSLNNLVQ